MARLRLSIYISSQPGAQQQTRHGRTDTRPLHRPAYYDGSVKNRYVILSHRTIYLDQEMCLDI